MPRVKVMKKINRRDNQEVRNEIDDVFTKIFLLSLRLENIGNKTLKKDQLSIKQFLLIAAIESFDEPPSIKEVANMVSTSHQNVKEIADRLEKRGFIKIERDEKDKRILRLKTTEKNTRYWASRLEEHEDVIFAMFHPFTDKEIHTFKILINKFLDYLEKNF
jgi:DNA-binding MarR family transcriptional regulator